MYKRQAYERLSNGVYREARASVIVPRAESNVVATFLCQRDHAANQVDDIRRLLDSIFEFKVLIVGHKKLHCMGEPANQARQFCDALQNTGSNSGGRQSDVARVLIRSSVYCRRRRWFNLREAGVRASKCCDAVVSSMTQHSNLIHGQIWNQHRSATFSNRVGKDDSTCWTG